MHFILDYFVAHNRIFVLLGSSDGCVYVGFGKKAQSPSYANGEGKLINDALLTQLRIHNVDQLTSLRPPSVKSKFWTPSAFKKSTNLSAKMAILFWLQFQLVSSLCCFILICMKAPPAQFAIFEVWVRSTVKVLISEG